MNAKELIKINNLFYQKTAPFFSQTRQNSWRGWENLPLPKNGEAILDVAAGNLRFGKFLQSKNIDLQNYFGIDACRQLLNYSGMAAAQFLEIDLLAEFLQNKSWQKKLPPKDWKYLICSAFFHHIPEKKWRMQFLQDFAQLVTDEGIIAVSFWQFMDDPNSAERVVENLGNNDYLLNWKQGVTAIRYCHHFDDEEIDSYRQLMNNHRCTLVADYRADGADNRSNRYLVWQKK